MGFDFVPFNRPVTLTHVGCTAAPTPPPPPPTPAWDPSPGESPQQRWGKGINKKAGQSNLVESLCVPGPAKRNKFVDLCLPDSTLHIQA